MRSFLLVVSLCGSIVGLAGQHALASGPRSAVTQDLFEDVQRETRFSRHRRLAALQAEQLTKEGFTIGKAGLFGEKEAYEPLTSLQGRGGVIYLVTHFHKALEPNDPRVTTPRDDYSEHVRIVVEVHWVREDGEVRFTAVNTETKSVIHTSEEGTSSSAG